jgi:Methyltransferase domain
MRNRRWMPQAAHVPVPYARGMRFADEFSDGPHQELKPNGIACNPLRTYFETHDEGPGIWKWSHYFDVYHRHFQKFIGTDVHVMEIGVYSGGSLGMWRDYFGPRCHVTGIDIEPACAAYKTDGIDIVIGDQSDRRFLAEVRATIPRVDILIDDGSHYPEHQIVTLEEMLPHVAPGGIYVCEDTHGSPNYFASYISGLSSRLNGGRAKDFGTAVDSVHSYPLMTVIEKTGQPRMFKDEKRGTQWAPFTPQDR